MQEEKLTYEEAMQRLEDLTKRMESGEITVDQMAESLRQAQKWMKQFPVRCQRKGVTLHQRCRHFAYSL